MIAQGESSQWVIRAIVDRVTDWNVPVIAGPDGSTSTEQVDRLVVELSKSATDFRVERSTLDRDGGSRSLDQQDFRIVGEGHIWLRASSPEGSCTVDKPVVVMPLAPLTEPKRIMVDALCHGMIDEGTPASTRTDEEILVTASDVDEPLRGLVGLAGSYATIHRSGVQTTTIDDRIVSRRDYESSETVYLVNLGGFILIDSDTSFVTRSGNDDVLAEGRERMHISQLDM